MLPFNIGAPELIILLVLVLIVFGVGRLPEVGGAIGKSIREFRKSQAGQDEVKAQEKQETKEKQEQEAQEKQKVS
jgi:sec-independent protein translocase protein TatA